MMEHISMHDWYENKSSLDEIYFVEEDDLDHCTTEKILRNQFYDPLVSSESEDEARPNKINWDQIFKKNKQCLKDKLFVACLRPSPPYPKVSEITPEQHTQILKVLSADNPNVLEDLFLGKPTRQDFKTFEAVKETYLKEQKEYKEWAKSLWVTDHCIRALRPKPAVERVYEAEFKVKAQRMQALPKQYNIAAHISLENQIHNCDAVFKQDLIRVTLAEMPTVQIPDKIERQICIIRPCTVPEPCQKHPYQIVLPNEDTLSTLPITEIHHELAKFALANHTHFIASENALKCLTQWNRHWLLPLSVCETVGPDGNRTNVMVLDSEFSVHKEAAPMRTYKAFRHLLENALIPSSEKQRIWEIRVNRAKKKEARVASVATPKLNVNAKPAPQPTVQDLDVSSDDEDNHLFIDTGEDVEMAQPKVPGLSLPKAKLSSSSATCLSPKAGFTSPSAGSTSANGGYLLRNASCLSPKAGFASPNASITSPKVEFAPPKVNITSPKAGFASPNSGYALRNASCLSPRREFSSPSASINSPKAGFASPKVSITSPKAGFASPNSGYALRNANISSPKAGFTSPIAGITSPKAGFASPNSGYALRNASITSPKAGFTSPIAGITSPKAGFASPNSGYALRNASITSPKAGFASPSTGITSPKAGFAPPKASITSPRAGFASPNSGYALRNASITSPKAGFASPSTGFTSPNPGYASRNASITSPKAGFASPSANITSSNSGYALRNSTCLSPKAGFASPSASITSPKAGLSPAKASITSPKAGFSPAKASITSPRAGFVSPSASITSPRAGLYPAKASITSPRAGFTSPRAGFTSPKPGLTSPRAEFAPPNAGFISPTASFGSPKELSFGPTPAKQMRGKTDVNPRRSARLTNQESGGCVTKPSSSKDSEECPVVPDIGVYSCTCKDTLYEKPPRRSFKKWQFRKEGSYEKHDIIIHSPHKAKDKTGELLLEPLPEYQIDLGASEQSPDAVRSAALSLALRKNASLLNVRVDGPTGDIVAFEKLTSEAFSKRHPDVMRQVISTVHTALSQLQELRPGHYVLQHDPSHGSNAMLMSPRPPREKPTLQLNFDAAQLIEVDEAHMAKIPPTITTALLPYHKHRRTLPCAFTPYENMVARETKKPPPKKKAPPQAIKFPKKKRKKNNRW